MYIVQQLILLLIKLKLTKIRKNNTDNERKKEIVAESPFSATVEHLALNAIIMIPISYAIK